MVRRKISISSLNSTFVCLGFGIFLGCAGISLLRATSYQLQIAEYKLAVNTALHEVREEIDRIDRTVETAPIATEQKQKIQESTQKSDAVLEEVQKDIEGEKGNLSIGPQEK
jgi:hypothetical protein